MKILVQKFGGTSVASQEARIAVKDMQKAVRSGFVCCSCFAMTKGEPYATDTLIKRTEGNESFSQRARTGYDDVLRRDHGSLRYGSDAAEIRDQCYGAYGRSGRDYYDSQFGAAWDQKYQCQQFASFIESGVIPIVCGVSGYAIDGK